MSTVTGYEPPLMRTAAAILRAAQKDIKDGFWICDSLLVWDGFMKRPAGCAIGLVGINGGVVRRSSNGLWCDLIYPSEASAPGADPEAWPRAALDALQMLAATVPLEELRRLGVSLKNAESAVMLYNDSPLDAEVAYAWFGRAADLAQERGL